MRQYRAYLIALIVCVLITACATAQLTADQQARVAIDRAQTQLNVWWDVAGTFGQDPKNLATWRTVIVPAFDVANRALRTTTIQLQKGDVAPAQIEPLVRSIVDDLMKVLTAQGVLK